MLNLYNLVARFLTKLTYYLTRIRINWIKNILIRIFIYLNHINLDDTLHKELICYKNFNEFFTRALKPEARPIAVGEKTICCPVDGLISQIGSIRSGILLQAKDKFFSIKKLLGGNSEYTYLFQNGSFITIYLAPSNYHRVHMPFSGKLAEMLYIPGQILSVSPYYTKRISELFSNNERLIVFFNTTAGQMAVVFVGAINVVAIETVWSGIIHPPIGGFVGKWNYYKEDIYFKKGTEIGRFNMGSTVILLFSDKKILWDSQLKIGHSVKMGQLLGYFMPDLLEMPIQIPENLH